MRVTKHHGLGNDFLVLLDPAGAAGAGPDLARALCDRHTGVGADGLLLGTRGDDTADLGMTLWNADGSVAEMSGNGIRCLVQAALAAGLVDGPVVEVATMAGLRRVEVKPGPDDRTIEATVDMGEARVVRSTARQAEVDVGNPHLVVLDPDGLADLAELGPAHPDVNVEVIRPALDGAVDLRVWERGVGPTEACGTGAVAAAVAAHRWGLVGDRVVVRMPGGAAEVGLGDTATLTGPATFVAAVEVPWP
ncbi:MAG TPA: diaminopimelate epimerase [Acidimicrobiales bacterium]|jgi:diaminopimelate epimerase